MLSRRLCRAFSGPGHYPMRREQPYDLGRVLRNLEERIFNKKLNRQEAQYEELKTQMDVTLKDPVLKQYFVSEKKRAERNDSEFRSFKVDHLKEDTTDMAKTIDQIREKLDLQQAKFFGVNSGAEFDKRSMKMMDAFRLHREVDLDSSNSELDNLYGRFDVYKKNYADLTNTGDIHAENNFGKSYEEYFGSAISKFVNNLDEDVLNKDFIMGGVVQGVTNNVYDYEKVNTGNVKDLTPDDKLRIQREDYRSRIRNSKSYASDTLFYGAEGFFDFSSHYANIDTRRLSVGARLQIYLMYLEGHSIREICIRYGIAPQRAKAVVVPRVSTETIILGMECEQLYSMWSGTQDYGLDLEWLMEEVGGNIDYGVRFADNNTPPPKRKNNEGQSQQDKEFVKLVKNKNKKKMDVLPVGFYGEGASGYNLKEMVVHRAHGAHREGKMFERIVRLSHVKDSAPVKARADLNKGPRIASKGFTHH